MTLADQKLETMPKGRGKKVLGLAADDTPVLTPWLVLAQSGVAVSHTGDTLEFALATVTLPGGLLGANGAIRITSQWTVTNNANSKTMRTRLGGIAGALLLNTPQTTVLSYTDVARVVQNRNSESSQVTRATSVGSGNSSTTATGTAAIDTSVDQTIVFTGQCANAGDTVTLESYLIEVLAP